MMLPMNTPICMEINSLCILAVGATMRDHDRQIHALNTLIADDACYFLWGTNFTNQPKIGQLMRVECLRFRRFACKFLYIFRELCWLMKNENPPTSTLSYTILLYPSRQQLWCMKSTQLCRPLYLFSARATTSPAVFNVYDSTLLFELVGCGGLKAGITVPWIYCLHAWHYTINFIGCIEEDTVAGIEVNTELMSALGIDHRLPTAYHPQANGLDERYNKPLVNSLSKFAQKNRETWDKKLGKLFMPTTRQCKSQRGILRLRRCLVGLHAFRARSFGSTDHWGEE